MSCAYHAIANMYDRQNAEIDYVAWADFVEELFRRHLSVRPSLVLDLACGTGSMTIELARRGYDMIGIDGSADMLAVAMDRTYDAALSGILYLMQDMRSFELYGTVGAITCCLDSINYLTAPADLDACLAAAHNYLDPDGLLIFDVNTPYKFEHIYGDNAYILEDDDPDAGATYCGWQNLYDPATRLCSFDLTVFREETDGRWRREEESHTERCYTQDELTDALRRAGFETVGIWGGWDLSAPTDTCERWYIAARAKKS